MHPGVLGHRRPVDVSRQAQLALLPSHIACNTATLQRHIHIHTYIQRDPRSSLISLSLKPNPEGFGNPHAHTTPPDNCSFCAPGNIIIIISTSTRSLTRSLRPGLAPTLSSTHASTRIHPPRTQHFCRSCRVRNADRLCFYLLYQVLACICFLYQVPNTVPTTLHPRHPVFLVDCSYKTAPDAQPPRLACPLLLLAVHVQRTSITRLAPRPCLFDPFSRPFEQKTAELIPLPTRGRAFFTCYLAHYRHPGIRRLPRALCDQPPTHFATTTIPQLARPNNIQPSP